MRRTKEEVMLVNELAAAAGKTVRWARGQRQQNSKVWQDWLAGRGVPMSCCTVPPSAAPGSVDPCVETVDCASDDSAPGGTPPCDAPLDNLAAARAKIPQLHAIAEATLRKAARAASDDDPAAEVKLSNLNRATQLANDNLNRQYALVAALERDAGLYVPLSEVEQLPVVVRSLGDTLRELRTHLASALPPEVVPDLYRAWARWAREQWNPAVRQRSDSVSRPSRFLDGLLVADPPRPSEWVQTLVMPVETSPNSPGRVSLARSPYMVEPLDATMNPEVEHIYLVWAAQTGKTTLCELALASKIEFEPGPLLWALPSDRLAQPFSAGRLQPFIKANPALKKHIRQDDPSAFNPMDMRLDNMPIYMTGTASPARLSSRPIPFAIIDEEAKIEQTNKREAHPVDLIVERTKAFPRRMVIHASTPNTEESPFWQGYLATDQRHYRMPCIHCGQEIEFEFNRETLVWEESDDYDVIERTAHYVCPHCHGSISDADKAVMMSRGRWVATNPNAHHSQRGYHLNSLYSPFVTFGTFAVEFVRAAHDMFAALKLHNFKNSWEALPFIPYTSRVDDEMVLALRDPSYKRGQLPVTPYYVVVGYDPGETVTHWLAAAITQENQIYVLDWGTLLGIKTDIENGQQGIAYHFANYSIEGQHPFLGFADSGYATTLVYDECRKVEGLLPTKGAATREGSWTKAPVRSHPGLDLYSYSDYSAKTELYAESIARRAGRDIHLPSDIDRELLVGLTGQMLVTRPGGGQEWRRVPDDHLGDCLKLCMVSLWVCGRVNPLLTPESEEQEQKDSNHEQETASARADQ